MDVTARLSKTDSKRMATVIDNAANAINAASGSGLLSTTPVPKPKNKPPISDRRMLTMKRAILRARRNRQTVIKVRLSSSSSDNDTESPSSSDCDRPAAVSSVRLAKRLRYSASAVADAKLDVPQTKSAPIDKPKTVYEPTDNSIPVDKPTTTDKPKPTEKPKTEAKPATAATNNQPIEPIWKLTPSGDRELNDVVHRPRLSVMRCYREFPDLTAQEIRRFAALTPRQRRVRWMACADNLTALVAMPADMKTNAEPMPIVSKPAESISTTTTESKTGPTSTDLKQNIVSTTTSISNQQRRRRLQRLADDDDDDKNEDSESDSRSNSNSSNEADDEDAETTASSCGTETDESTADDDGYDYDDDERGPPPALTHGAIPEGRRSRSLFILDMALQTLASVSDFARSSLWLVWSGIVLSVDRSASAPACATCGLFAPLSDTNGRSCPLCLTRQCAACFAEKIDIHKTINRIGSRFGRRSMKSCDTINKFLYEEILQFFGNDSPTCSTCLLPATLKCSTCGTYHYCGLFCAQIGIREKLRSYCNELAVVENRGELNPNLLVPTVYYPAAGLKDRERRWRRRHPDWLVCQVCHTRGAVESCNGCLSRDYCGQACRNRDRTHVCSRRMIVADTGASVPANTNTAVPIGVPKNRRERRAAAAAAAKTTADSTKTCTTTADSTKTDTTTIGPTKPKTTTTDDAVSSKIDTTAACSTKANTTTVDQKNTDTTTDRIITKPTVSGSHPSIQIDETTYRCDDCLNPLVSPSGGECGGCRSAYYCSIVCQKRSWTAGHQTVCLAGKKSSEVCRVCKDSRVLALACGGCKSAFYCSIACQDYDWIVHRTVCRGSL